jgi:prepilin-type N-terminal cleavage/methylation domain-containing protein/prepilin-type processing-associated H-X9-DG protein
MERVSMRRGFTLIELLIVVAVIAILIGILLPALGESKELAKTTVCLSNVRNLNVAACAYCTSFRDYFPPSRDGTSEWDFLKTTDALGNPTIVPGILWQGGTNLKIQQCPSYTGRSGTLTDPYTGYNYNTSFIGHGVGEATPTPSRTVDIVNPQRCAVFGDGQYFGGVTDKYMRSPLLYPASPDTLTMITRSAGTQGYRHLAKTNVGYADGHAETRSERFTAGSPVVTAGTGFLSSDNSAYSNQ